MFHVNKGVLLEVYRSGRFKKEPNLVFTTAKYDEFYNRAECNLQAIEFQAAPIQSQLLGNPFCKREVWPQRVVYDIGCCWEDDFSEVFALAAMEHDTESINPNLSVFRIAFHQVQIFCKSAEASLIAERPGRQVINLQDYRLH